VSLGHEVEEMILSGLPSGWTRATVTVTLEREPSMNAAPADVRTAAIRKLAANGGRLSDASVEFEVTPGTWTRALADARAVERSGIRGQVELRDVVAARPEDLQRWPGRNALTGKPAAVPGGYAFRLEAA
jgi:hypothetical protein